MSRPFSLSWRPISVHSGRRGAPGEAGSAGSSDIAAWVAACGSVAPAVVPVMIGSAGFQVGDLGGVVSEYSPSAPDLGTSVAIEQCAPPQVVPFEAVDAGFAAGAPLDQPHEASLPPDGGALRAWTTSSWDGHETDTQDRQCSVDGGVPVTAVRGHRFGIRPKRALIRSIGGPPSGRRADSDYDWMVEHDPVDVVGDVAFVADLDGPAARECRRHESDRNVLRSG